MNLSIVIPMFVILAIIFLLGMWASGHIKSSKSFLDDYFLGGRQMGGFILAMTMTATYGSASSFIGGPGTAYVEGFGWVLLSMAQLCTGYFVLMVLGKKFAIVTRQYNAVTLVDFLKERYRSKWVVILSSISIVVFLFSAMVAQWVGGGRLLQSLTGISYESALIIFTISVMVYVVAGGFRAVAITDAVQGTIMFFGTIILLIATIYAGGGTANIVHTLQLENPNFITPFGANGSLSPIYVSSFWILVGVGVVGLPQIAVRAMSYKNAKAMHRAIIIGTIVVGMIMLGMHLVGVFARAIIPGIEVPDTVMPLIAVEVLPTWLVGIVLSAPLAAIMSTVDSLLLLVSSSIIRDVYLNYFQPKATEKQIKGFSMIITALVGIIVFVLAFRPPDLIIWLNLFAFGGLESVFIWPVILGLYWKRANKYGAIFSMVTGITSYIFFHNFYPNPFGMHTVVLPIVLSFVAFMIGSYSIQDKGEKLT